MIGFSWQHLRYGWKISGFSTAKMLRGALPSFPHQLRFCPKQIALHHFEGWAAQNLYRPRRVGKRWPCFVYETKFFLWKMHYWVRFSNNFRRRWGTFYASFLLLYFLRNTVKSEHGICTSECLYSTFLCQFHNIVPLYICGIMSSSFMQSLRMSFHKTYAVISRRKFEYHFCIIFP